MEMEKSRDNLMNIEGKTRGSSEQVLKEDRPKIEKRRPIITQL